MMLISHWYDWYNIDVKSWTFLEPGEAKTTVDSHHASIAHAIKRYVCVGCNLKEDSDIEAAITNLGAGISNLYEWQWPKNDEHAGLVKARPLPNIGEWTYYSSTEFSKPTPETSTSTIPSSSWTIPKPYGLGMLFYTIEWLSFKFYIMYIILLSLTKIRNKKNYDYHIHANSRRYAANQQKITGIPRHYAAN
ncbi:unnamed protein product [Rhizophagus irregularis]|nr:unnamed protein product [Rhizophagus irregularis]